MKPESMKYAAYLAVLREELLTAEGCTEPAAVAYAAARCREILGEKPERCALTVSGPIIKNVMSVTVPHTGGGKGLTTAVAAGAATGNASRVLEVLSDIDKNGLDAIKAFLRDCPVTVIPADNGVPFYIDITMTGGGHEARVVIRDTHTRITVAKRDGADAGTAFGCGVGACCTGRTALDIAGIYDFCSSVHTEDIREAAERMIQLNTAISEEGLRGGWGEEVGRTLLSVYGADDVICRARAAAAAGSDARMSGCEMPVVIVSGSGNQGLAASLPVIEFARHLGSDRETLYRALMLSVLVTVHIKSGIGPVSAFCGAVCAGAGAGCGIAFLQGADLDAVNHTIVNSLAICSGMICDGAKPSCAAKIAMAVDAGILGYSMYRHNRQFRRGEGIVKASAEKTIAAVNDVAHEGMRETDRVILEVMLDSRDKPRTNPDTDKE